MVQSKMLSGNVGVSADAAAKEWAANIIPGVTLVIRRMDLSTRAEHFRKMATRYQELAEFARPPDLSHFCRSYAVRYGVMAREALEWAERHPSQPYGGGRS
jgi:hypothetical protein